MLYCLAFIRHADEQVASESSQEAGSNFSSKKECPDGAIDTSAQGEESASGQKVIYLKQILSIQMTFTDVLLKKKELLETLN